MASYQVLVQLCKALVEIAVISALSLATHLFRQFSAGLRANFHRHFTAEFITTASSALPRY
jgi:hypothetical protein